MLVTSGWLAALAVLGPPHGLFSYFHTVLRYFVLFVIIGVFKSCRIVYLCVCVCVLGICLFVYLLVYLLVYLIIKLFTEYGVWECGSTGSTGGKFSVFLHQS